MGEDRRPELRRAGGPDRGHAGALRRFEAGPLAFDVPVLGNHPAPALTAAALVAIFRFKLGPLPVLPGCELVGGGYWMFVGPFST